MDSTGDERGMYVQVRNETNERGRSLKCEATTSEMSPQEKVVYVYKYVYLTGSRVFVVYEIIPFANDTSELKN